MAFPIPVPERLPTRIQPCPIVEAILEVRFVTEEPWTTLPGLLYAQIRNRFSKQRDLPLAGWPEELRRQDSALTYLPLMQFNSDQFTLQFGPRVLNLVSKANVYPGWPALSSEMTWVLERARASGFLGEAERLSARYIDYFPGDIFPELILRPMIGEIPFESKEMSISTVLRRGPITARLALTNSAILGTSDESKRGSVLDLDAWVGPLDFNFENAMSAFGELHLLVKEMFFGLLKPEFLAQLNPTYS